MMLACEVKSACEVMKTHRNDRCANQYNCCDKPAPIRSQINTKTKSTQCRMTESVELCTQISTQTTARHHRDEELPVANVRICRTVCTDQLLVKESNIEKLRIHRTVDAHRPRVSESKELLIQIDRGCVTKKTECQNQYNCC